jgi:hypothetical protein
VRINLTRNRKWYCGLNARHLVFMVLRTNRVHPLNNVPLETTCWYVSLTEFSAGRYEVGKPDWVDSLGNVI